MQVLPQRSEDLQITLWLLHVLIACHRISHSLNPLDHFIPCFADVSLSRGSKKLINSLQYPIRPTVRSAIAFCIRKRAEAKQNASWNLKPINDKCNGYVDLKQSKDKAKLTQSSLMRGFRSVWSDCSIIKSSIKRKWLGHSCRGSGKADVPTVTSRSAFHGLSGCGVRCVCTI